MYIKIYCPCGAKFAFDVEPANGQMPVPIACPTCGQDATAMANEQIQAQLAPPPAPESAGEPPNKAKPSGRLHVALPGVETGQPGASALRLTVDRHEPAAHTETTAPRPSGSCPKHLGQPIVETCRVCGKPICRQCMAMFGYVCSAYCRNKAEAEGLDLPVYAQQRTVLERKARGRNKAVVAALLSILILAAAAGIYYKAYASKPRVVQMLPLATEEFGGGYCKLLEDGTYIVLTSGKMSLHNTASDDAVWKVTFNEEGPGFIGGQLTLLDQRNDLWIRSGNRLLCIDRRNGSRKHQVTIEGYIEDCGLDNDTIRFVSTTGGSRRPADMLITSVALADGQVTTQPLADPEQPAARRGGRRANAQNSADEVSSSYFVTGPNVAELKVELLESRTIARETIKKPKQSIMDSGKVSGANAMQASEELLNEIASTGGGGVEYEDASRYQVTLRRCRGDHAGEWTEEVTGKVAFHTMKTVDLLVAGKSLRVFDKQNNLKWEAPLTYPVAESFMSPFGRDEAPALETGNTLYFFDKGMLTAFDSTTGTPRWRVTSVGIRQVQLDSHGALYVSTSTAGAEDIEYSNQIKVIDAVENLLMKVDAATGEVLWQTRLAGDHCFLSGDYVYATKSTFDLTLALHPENGSAHFRVIRLDPKTGKRIWTYYQPQEARALDFMDNVILLEFSDQIQVLKYMSL